MDISKLANLAISPARQIAVALSHTAQRFPSDEKQHAEILRQRQPLLWTDILSSVTGPRKYQQLKDDLLGKIDQIEVEINLVRPKSNKIDLDAEDLNLLEVTANVPLLTEDRVGLLKMLAQKNSDLIVGALIFELTPLSNEIRTTSLPAGVLTGMLRYASGGQPVAEISKRVDEFQDQIRKAQSSSQDVSAKLREDSTTFLTDERDKLVAFKASLSEEMKVRSASELWKDRAVSHRWVTATAFVTFIALLAVALYIVLEHAKQILDLLPRDKDNRIEYVSTLLFLVPAIGVGWVLRILARFIQNNSVLGDDARQRQAMIRTYLTLVADKDSGVSEKDRLIMLNAIFRPLPGAQVDEVAPPTILDLLKKET